MTFFRKITVQFFFICFIIANTFSLFSQDKEKQPFSIEASYFTGNIYEHNKDIGHLITGHPEGFMLMYNKKTFGKTEASRRYNFPDWGFSFIYQDMKNQYLGDNYSIYGHYNWFFLKRNLRLSIGTGLDYNTNHYDINTNYQNNAYGTSLLSTSFLKIGYVRENLWQGLGFDIGLLFVHYSNGNFRAPNTSTNTYALQAGINYLFNHTEIPEYNVKKNDSSYSEKIKYNIALRFGLQESDVIGLGQHPFYVLSGFADKRLGFKSTVQAGIDVFVSPFLKDFVKYRSIAFPEDGLTGDEDFKRVGVFLGYEHRFYKNAFQAQLGYYVYWPSEFENRVYNRLGIKRYFLKSKYFATVSVKSHWAKAEAIEFGLGIRL